MTKTVSVEEAETQLHSLIDLAEQGEEVVIAKSDQAKVKLVPIPVKNEGKRVFGRHRGQAWISEDFDAPLPEDFWLSGNP